MKISLEFEDNNAMYEVMDSLFLGMLKRELESTESFLQGDGWKHPDDVKTWKKQVKALKYLIVLYGG